MNVDHYISGKTEVSQDYALSGTEPVPYAIIADGCSSAKYSDVGAMVLAHAARNVLGSYSDMIISDYYQFGNAVINKAVSIAYTLGRPKTILDATLGIVWVKDGVVHCRFYGDGVIFWVTDTENELCWQKISFDNNMPYYLRYWVDPENKKIYEDQQIKLKTDFSLSQEIEYDFDVPPECWHSVNETALVGIASDGLTALFDKNNDSVLELEDVLKEVIALKNRAGSFIVRRMRRMLDNYKKKGIVQGDDISVGVVSL